MRRRRWARAATVLSCLAIAVVLQLAAVAEGRSTPSLLPSPRRAHGDGHGHARPRTYSGSGLPPPSPAPGARATTTVHHAVAAASGVGASVRFDAATAAAGAAAVRCKNGGRNAESGASGGDACADAEEDKRRIPTGPNPLHNR